MSIQLVPTGVGIAVEIAVGGSGGRWDTDRWDVGEWSQSDTSLGSWVDVTCDCSEVHIAGGATTADGCLTRWEARTCTVSLWGPTYDPWNGPWAGLLTPGLPVRVRWCPPGSTSWQVAFTGTVDDSGYSWDPATFATVLGCVDDTAILAAWNGLATGPVGDGETADQRVNRILDAAGWPASLRAISPSTVTLVPTDLSGAAWEMLLAVADTDLAMCWVNRAGVLTYIPLGRVQTDPGPPLHIIDPACPTPAGHVQATSLGTDSPHVTRNIVRISRQAYDTFPAATVTVQDAQSIARFRAHTYERTDLVHTDPNWSTTIAQVILGAGAWPTITPTSAGVDVLLGAEAAALLLASEPQGYVQVLDQTGRAWKCIVLGSDVTIAPPNVLSGTLILDDLTRLQGDRWQQTTWDHGKWAV